MLEVHMEEKYADVLRSLELRALDKGICTYHNICSDVSGDTNKLKQVPTNDFLDFIAEQYAWSAWKAGKEQAQAEEQKQRLLAQRKLLLIGIATLALYAGSVSYSLFSRPDIEQSAAVSSSVRIPANSSTSAGENDGMTIQPYPPTGTPIYSYCDPSERIAPLTIKPSSNSAYYIKLVSVDNPTYYLTFFIRPGETTECLVPLGNFELRYASGSSWYGADYLFGTETSYAKADNIFSFTFDGSYYNGYTVTLYPIENGNMETTPIQPNAF